MLKKMFALLLSMLIFSHVSAENEKPSSSKETVIPQPVENESLFSLLDQPQQYIAAGFLGFSKSIDEFFSDEKAEYESNGSYIRLTGDAVFTDGEGWGYFGSTRAKLLLPNTQRKLRLIFETDPEQNRNDAQSDLENNPLNAADRKSYFAGLEGLVGEFDNWRFRPAIGLKLNRRLDIYARMRASRNYEISENWQGYLGNTLFWFHSTGYRFNALLNLDYRIDEHRLFRSATSAQREEENTWWDLTQVFSITHRIDRKQALIYLAGIYGLNEPNTHAETYQLQLRYRRLIHADYLYLEIVPQLQYTLGNDFEPVFSTTFRVEMVFKK